MAKLSTDELLDAFKEMTLIELSEFVKQFEETFGVTAAAPVAVAAAPAAGGAAGGGDAAAADQDEFDVILENAGDKKIQVIKGGYMDGRPLSVEEVTAIADLETREVLLAKLAGAMKGNLAKAAGLFQAPASQVARLAAALQEKKAAEAPAAAEADAPAES